MSFFEVTSVQVKNRADLLKELNQQYKSRFAELENMEQSLCSMWEGEAKSAFHREFVRDKSQVDLFTNLIEKYAMTLYEIAVRYEEAERRATELASSRSY